MTGTRTAAVLTGSLGSGPVTLAQACAGALDAEGWTPLIADTVELLGPVHSRADVTVFRLMLRVPGVFDALHYTCLRPGARMTRRMGHRRKLASRLRPVLDAAQPDLLISVFPVAAAAAASLAGDYPAVPQVVLCTDAAPHRLWVQPGVSLYLVTSHAAEAAVRRHEPQARVRVIPPPVRPEFYDAPPSAVARERHGVPAVGRCVLLTGGGWGIGPLAKAAEMLAAEGVHVLAVAGRNTRLLRDLKRAAARQPRVRPYGFTTEIPDLVAASDLVITTPGDTCAEARAVGRPLLLIDSIPGHGRDNGQHQLELGGALLASPRAADITGLALAFFADIGLIAAASPAAWEPEFRKALAAIGC